jgi:hypothetical protein
MLYTRLTAIELQVFEDIASHITPSDAIPRPWFAKDLRYEEKGTLLERLHRRNLEVENVTELRVAV